MGTLTLNDGTVLQNSYALLSSGSLFIYDQQTGTTLTDVFTAFNDPAKTARIVCTQVNGEEITFLNYSKLIAVRDEGAGLFTAVLTRGDENV